MKRLLPLLLLLLMPLLVPESTKAQVNPQTGHGAPSGPCLGPYTDIDTGNFYVCKVGQYSLAGSSSVSPNTPSPAKGYDPNNYASGLTINDAKATKTGTVVQGASTISDVTDSPWTSADVGKKIWCVFSNGTNDIQGGGVATIAAVNSSSQVSIAPSTIIGGIGTANNQQCAWYSNDATAAFVAAYNAAHAANANNIGVGVGPQLAYPGYMYCPPGGYVVSGPILNQSETTNNTFGVSLIGAGRASCNIYIHPSFASAGAGTIGLIYSQNTTGIEFSGFSVNGLNITLGTTFSGTQGFISLQNTTKFWVHNVEMYGPLTSDGNLGLLLVSNPSSVGRIENNLFTGGNVSFICVGCGQQHVLNNYVGNSNFSEIIQNSGAHTNQGGPFTIENQHGDECGSASGACHAFINSTVNIIGGVYFGTSGAAPISCDGTSSLYFTDVQVALYLSAGNNSAISEASGCKVYATGTTFAGNGTSAAVAGPAGASFFDAGLNSIQNCLNSTCNPVTATDYATHGFSGGIVPSPSIQMPQNTCNAVNGNLLATAQNLCSFVLTKNQQLTAIAAQSGGTTPANSACATPPVIMISDATRSATMTMTTGKTFWTSTVDAVTSINQVFASGATLTISIGANTCATPPVNVSVTYSLQSALNP